MPQSGHRVLYGTVVSLIIRATEDEGPAWDAADEVDLTNEGWGGTEDEEEDDSDTTEEEAHSVIIWALAAGLFTLVSPDT